MGLKRGSRGDAVKELQEALNAAGADLEVDGIFGPATEAALKVYQKKNDYIENGQVGNTLAGIMGIDLNVDEGSAGSPVATSKSGSDLLMPGEAVLWYDSDAKQYIVIYTLPGVAKPDGGTTDPIYVSWTVESDEDLEAVVGPDLKPIAARVLTTEQLTELGVVNFGGVDELRDWEGIEGDPLDTWAEDMASLAVTMPWILDDDYQQLAIMAVMEREDAQLTTSEIQQTEFWTTHTDDERRWMEISHGDPATAEKWKADSMAATEIKLRQAGVNNITPGMIEYMSMQTVTGAWSQDMLDFQITAISDPYSNVAPDAGLIQEMATQGWTPDATQEKEDTVRNLLDKWLGPAYGTWTDEQVAEKAGDLRNDPDAELAFIESLKDQRVAMLPGTEDRNVSYQDLAQPWKNFQQRAWGTSTVDETDPMFLSMLQNNDATANGELLQRHGMTRNVGKVVNDTRTAINEAFGGAVR